MYKTASYCSNCNGTTLKYSDHCLEELFLSLIHSFREILSYKAKAHRKVKFPEMEEARLCLFSVQSQRKILLLNNV